MSNNKIIEEKISKKRNTLKTDRLDMSFGELMNVYEDADLFITPEYQRVFRWSDFQQTRFIESVLLGIPIPPIFVAEDENGKWELVDGLQRISTIFSFFGILKHNKDKNNSTLTEGEMVKELKGTTIETLPLKLKTTIKRSVCRIEIVRWDSQEDVRYELFNRLNTGASPLSEQEIRNCIFRAYKVDLNQILREIAKDQNFIEIIGASESKTEQMFLEELALRYYAFKGCGEDFPSNIPHFLTEYMRNVSKGDVPFDLKTEKEDFLLLMKLLNAKFGKNAFRPNSKFALYIFDSIAYALPKSFKDINKNQDNIYNAIDRLLTDKEYADIGANTYSNTRLKSRMNRALEIFKENA
ncbi:DUF262 domain-containing protein [Halobacteriovorax sp. JY17]|uniref:DUF262 domain-containing protein n=1 Tax=Halobacteriovorax sp. JY17 TaxID=2014617 RepID=UPI000C53901F|nr:DUF262 domain-containing protein [Halobacteriovorax sp. JY17]PIK15107.1 MAG: hypothetical protein CES88_12300 [Halobacteriovorax sp. JY17]